jgi:hypothetical protein
MLEGGVEGEEGVSGGSGSVVPEPESGSVGVSGSVQESE